MFCILCRQGYLRYESQEHMHSLQHHQELETVLGMNQLHQCFVCKVSTVSLCEYGQHISTAEHIANLRKVKSKPISLCDTLTYSTIGYLRARNKTLERKNANLSYLKRRLAEIQKRQRKSAQVNAWTHGPIQETHQTGGNYAVVQNKENKVASQQSPLYQTETPRHNQSGRLAASSGEHAGKAWHQGFVGEHAPQPPHQMRHDGNISVCNQFSVNGQHSQTERQCNTQGSTPADAPEQMTWCVFSQYDRDYRQYNGVFDKGQNECAASSQPELEASHSSSNPAPENTSTSAAPVKHVNVPSMLKQIRRALGVREPCRAEREARKQNGEAAVRVAGHSTAQQTATQKAQHSGAGATSVQSPQVYTPAPAAHAGVSASNIASANPKQTAFNVGQETTPHSETTSVVADGLSNNGERESQRVLASSVSRKVRIAHKSGKSQEVKKAGLKPTPNKLLTSSGAKNRQSRTGVFSDVKRKKQDRFIGRPRFGIKLAKRSNDQAGTSQPQDTDLPLSEGFHWDSIPYTPSDIQLNSAPPAQDTTNTSSHRETQSDPQMQEPCTAQQGGGSSPTVTAVSIKVEPQWEHENQVLGDNGGAKKRQHNSNNDSFDKDPGVKMKRANKGQDQMDQLLSVSLREDELSHSLQDLDKNLVQARSALQAAYTEVQQLLLLRQQFTSEVDCLRTKRIEILQGMQEGYSRASHVLEKASTSSPGGGAAAAAAAAATTPLQPRLSPHPTSSAFLMSSGQKSPATMTLSTIAGQANHFDSSRTAAAAAAPEVPLKHPVPLFPSDPPRHVAAPTLPAAALTSVNTESSAGQKEQESRQGLKDCVKTARDAQEAVWTVESDSQEEAERNQTKGRRSASGKTIPEGDRNTSAAVPVDGDGNESDDSVKMIESDKVLINLESEDEDSPDIVSDVPLHKESRQSPASVALSSVSTQTSQQLVVDRKNQFNLLVKVDKAPVESVKDEEPSLGVFPNHSGPVHALQIHGGMLYTCSGDNTARAYSLATRECKAVFDGHTHKVNCLLVSSLPNMSARLYTGSSDETVRCYSIKSNKCLERISLQDRVLCLHIAWNTLYVGLANGSVATYDSKTLKQLDVFECHGPRGVSCLANAQEGARRVLLVGSYDSTISVRDAKNGLLLRSLEGHTKTVLCMKVVNDLVFSGSSDTSVHAHNIHTGELIRIYKGHNHAVTSISILGKVMVTACLDKLVRVYELQSHDRLQVYGGHSDMVMCMSIHKSVIYTGCYDGSIQAVKLNVMKNHRCWWHNCSLIFGMAEHLVQHLVGDHTNQKLQTVKCRWRNCNSFFCTQQSVQQELPVHMQHHVQKDSEFSHD
ncbi:zinc finger protein 106 isoform X3 [Solea solea]|uniref:zinc finger protein 106 isoform X3 n=1 Tax=Solea solea TaxID=90069 RepID=UPI00272C4A68|nr:zinc finger protein 106 isoform X3 [Solea solea]